MHLRKPGFLLLLLLGFFPWFFSFFSFFLWCTLANSCPSSRGRQTNIWTSCLLGRQEKKRKKRRKKKKKVLFFNSREFLWDRLEDTLFLTSAQLRRLRFDLETANESTLLLFAWGPLKREPERVPSQSEATITAFSCFHGPE